MAHDSTETHNTTFAGGANHGLQQGSFSGQQTNHFHMAGVGKELLLELVLQD